MDLLKNFSGYIQSEDLFRKTDRLLLAVSGGVDSVVLCAVCRQAGYDFIIAHCNFKLRGADSDRDEKFVATLAENYGVEFFTKTFDTASHARLKRQSIEEAARELRYAWFNELMSLTETQAPKYIVTAHHADDNIETVLMNFFRGTGISGMRGILPKQGNLVRPLLFARRSELEAYIKSNDLAFVTDHTNLANDYTRNYFRNKIIPLVSETFPEAGNNVLNNIRRFREIELLYQQSVALHKKKLLVQKGNEVHIPVLRLLNVNPISTIVYEIIKDFGFTAHQTGEVVALLKSDSGKYVQSASYRILNNRKWLIISPRTTTDAANILIEEHNRSVLFPGGSLKLVQLGIDDRRLSTDSNLAMVDATSIVFPLLLRRWKQGDYFYPLGMQKKKKLSRFLIDKKLSLIEKENTWVLEMNKKIIWVLGLRIDDRFKITGQTKELLSIQFIRSR